MIRLEARPELLDTSIARVLGLPKPLFDFLHNVCHAHDDSCNCNGGISRSGKISGTSGATGAKSPALQESVAVEIKSRYGDFEGGIVGLPEVHG
jgi:hypothetical protein